jgi:hypothetical protein
VVVVTVVVLLVVMVWCVQGDQEIEPDGDDHHPAGQHVKTRATSSDKVTRS